MPEGASFASRKAASDAGIHRPPVAGISGVPWAGADSICVSGGYPDDSDYWNEIIYTGQGGNETRRAVRQVRDQVLEGGNLALAVSADEGLPVRVLRGFGGDPKYSPQHGYRYDGLHFVDRYWSEIGRTGYRVWRFRLLRGDEAGPGVADGLDQTPGRMPATIQRVVRNTQVAQSVKDRYDHRCQICGERVETAAGPYAEASHVQPLGRPHDGPDNPENVLCLCPNHHVRFDRGGLVLSDDLEIIEASTGRSIGKLRLVTGHIIGLAYVQYHRGMFTQRKNAVRRQASSPRSDCWSSRTTNH